jgi:hypothetical protein
MHMLKDFSAAFTGYGKGWDRLAPRGGMMWHKDKAAHWQHRCWK